MSLSNINDLFCTPEQGRRLKELMPELRSGLAWYVSPSIQKLEPVTSYMTLGNGGNYAPALTLQELRDVAKGRKLVRYTKGEYLQFHEAWDVCTVSMTAPELAAWVIERLEDVKK